MPDLKRVALTLVAVVLTSCAPPGSGGATRYEKCAPQTGPAFGCEVRIDSVSYGGSGLMWATGGGWTTEPPTEIRIEITIEKSDGAGGWVNEWHHENARSPVQDFSTQTEPQACGPGVYRAFMRVKFSGYNTIYYMTSVEVWVS